MQYRIAKEVGEMAEDLIFDHHEDLAEQGPRIVYLMVRKGRGKPASRHYRIRKVTGVQAFLAGGTPSLPEDFGFEQPDFVVIEVSWYWWETLPEASRKGLVDHMLSHLTLDHEKEQWSIQPPAYGEFPEVFERHGFWNPDKAYKRHARRIYEQLELLPADAFEDLDEEETDEEEKGENLQVSMRAGDGEWHHTDMTSFSEAAEKIGSRS